ncbi:dephospho-CoA kinase [Marinivivus vitaminiproducens]|uniref:dephospho-CoA kinase n=1 Tax=Marinivivus vitaminiproducens TaxID=3035935 RepID=UPI00279D8AD4|nr:dephospho-CoA kinase [Geminicoccaceae bacterium SCSIO 64248]
MLILGLTGGIAMGKSTAAGLFRAHGVPVFDADAAVHRLLAPGGDAVAAVRNAFPGTIGPDGGVDRAAVGRAVFGDDRALARLEAILHPLVQAAERSWLAAQARAGRAVAVLDVPLLLETGGEQRVDVVAVVSAPAFLQAQRVLRRNGMTQARLDAIRARQMPDREKRKRADFVLQSGLDRRATGRQIGALVDALRTGRHPGPRAWPDAWPDRTRTGTTP